MTDERPQLGSRWSRRALVLLVTATCVRAWLPDPLVPQASAQIPNAGEQRRDLVIETRRTNELLGEILNVLKTQSLKVRVESAAKPNAAPPSPPPGRQ